MNDSSPEAILSFQKGTNTRMGNDRLRLLRAIRDCGSISAAARKMGLSYKAAWDGVNAMNNLFSSPLVSGQSGGKRGGGALLTDAGLEVLEAFTRVQEALGQFMADLDARLSAPARHLGPNLLWSMSMKSSARNAFLCSIREIHTGAVNAEVILELADGQALVATISRQSIADLDLAPGGHCYALIKSSFIILLAGDAPCRTSARNCLNGTVVQREDGEVNSEISLDLGGDRTLTACITLESARELDLKPGAQVSALIKASHVILAAQ